MNKNEKMAKDILLSVGGEKNVSYFAHCMTRLRFNLKDESIINVDEVKNIPGVMGAQFSGGQFQIIIGPGVEKLYSKIAELGNFKTEEIVDDAISGTEKKAFSVKGLANNILNTIAGCLTPIIPILIVSGLIKMIVALIGPTMLNLVAESSDIFRLLSLVGDTGFYFFPIFVGLSGARKFGSNPMIALLLGGVLLHPNFVAIVNAGEPFSVYGIPMTLTNYSSTVIPMILITWIMSYVEKYIKKYTPDALSTLMVPLLTVLIMLPIGLCIVGPLGSILGTFLGDLLIGLRSVLGPFGVAIIGALFILIVATGMHLALYATAIISMTTIGYDNTVLVGAIIAVYASMAASLAFLIKSKNADNRALGLSCFISQSLGGVGEPTIFGIFFRYKKTLIFSMIGTFFGSLYAGFMNCAVYFAGASNFLVFLAFGGGEGNSSLIHGIIACGISFVITFVLMLVFGYENKLVPAKSKETENKKVKIEKFERSNI